MVAAVEVHHRLGLIQKHLEGVIHILRHTGQGHQPLGVAVVFKLLVVELAERPPEEHRTAVDLVAADGLQAEFGKHLRIFLGFIFIDLPLDRPAGDVVGDPTSAAGFGDEVIAFSRKAGVNAAIPAGVGVAGYEIAVARIAGVGGVGDQAQLGRVLRPEHGGVVTGGVQFGLITTTPEENTRVVPVLADHFARLPFAIEGDDTVFGHVLFGAGKAVFGPHRQPAFVGLVVFEVAMRIVGQPHGVNAELVHHLPLPAQPLVADRVPVILVLGVFVDATELGFLAIEQELLAGPSEGAQAGALRQVITGRAVGEQFGAHGVKVGLAQVPELGLGQSRVGFERDNGVGGHGGGGRGGGAFGAGGVDDMVAEGDHGGGFEGIADEGAHVEFGAIGGDRAGGQVNPGRAHVGVDVNRAGFNQPGLAEHPAVDEIQVGAGKTGLGLGVVVAHPHDQAVGLPGDQGRGEVKHPGRVGAEVLADLLVVDPNCGGGGRAFEAEQQTTALIGGGPGEFLAVPASGVVGQAGLAENMRHGDRLPGGGGGGQRRGGFGRRGGGERPFVEPGGFPVGGHCRTGQGQGQKYGPAKAGQYEGYGFHYICFLLGNIIYQRSSLCSWSPAFNRLDRHRAEQAAWKQRRGLRELADVRFG